MPEPILLQQQKATAPVKTGVSSGMTPPDFVEDWYQPLPNTPSSWAMFKSILKNALRDWLDKSYQRLRKFFLTPAKTSTIPAVETGMSKPHAVQAKPVLHLNESGQHGILWQPAIKRRLSAPELSLYEYESLLAAMADAYGTEEKAATAGEDKQTEMPCTQNSEPTASPSSQVEKRLEPTALESLDDINAWIAANIQTDESHAVSVEAENPAPETLENEVASDDTVISGAINISNNDAVDAEEIDKAILIETHRTPIDEGALKEASQQAVKSLNAMIEAYFQEEAN